jgi:hypothetical protein
MERREIVTTTEELSTLSDWIGLSDTSKNHLEGEDAALFQGVKDTTHLYLIMWSKT